MNSIKKSKSIDLEPEYSIKDFMDRYTDFQTYVPQFKPQLYHILNVDPMKKRKLKRFIAVNQKDTTKKKLLDRKHEEIDKVTLSNVA
ncbi:hypothetical protein HDV01_005621 [Terramyces sp. JEL0728]|nr:hypothetical protein HDV01_005621 [Terramyces sp. JEL0728]